MVICATETLLALANIFSMIKNNPTNDPEFKRVLNNLIKAPPKPHSEMKLGKPKRK